MVRMAIECPEGVEPGAALLVGGPDGEDVEVVVPEGVAPGDTFEVDVRDDDGTYFTLHSCRLLNALAFGLIGEVIARVSGQDYFDYVREHLLDPLQMTDSVYWLPEDRRQRMAVGYSPDLFRDHLKPAPYIGLGGVAALVLIHILMFEE